VGDGGFANIGFYSGSISRNFGWECDLAHTSRPRTVRLISLRLAKAGRAKEGNFDGSRNSASDNAKPGGALDGNGTNQHLGGATGWLNADVAMGRATKPRQGSKRSLLG